MNSKDVCRLFYFFSLNTRLGELGHHVGFRMVDTLCLREKTPKRETRVVNMLWFIQKTVWKVSTINLANKASIIAI